MTLRRWFGSVRAQVTLGAMLIVGIALLAVGALTWNLTASGMVREAQTAAEVQARNLAIVAEAGRLQTDLDVDVAGSAILQVVDAAGQVEAASRQLRDVPALTASVPPIGRAEARTVRVEKAGSATDYRTVALGVAAPDGPVAVVAGISLAENEQTLKTLTQALLVGSAIVLLVVGIGAWWVTGRALRPVEAIRREVAGFSDQDLTRRVPVPAQADEVQRLAITMNTMLDRLQEASQKQQAFVADAAHELRSPLASLRTQLEVTVAHPEGVTAQEVAAEALEDATRLQDLAADLLRLARLDAGEAPVAGPLNVAEAVAELLSGRQRDRAAVQFAVEGDAAPIALASQQDVDQVVTNLVDNAVRHAASTVQVRIASVPGDGAGPGGVSVVVTDDGPGIAPEDQQRVFDRFVRLDSTRSRDQGGTGLGLAIAREVARAGGGDVTLTGPAQFVFTLPAAD